MENEEIRIESSPDISSVDTIKNWFSREFKEPLVSLFLCTIGNLLTGIAMGIFIPNLKMLPALIVLIPASIDMRGNIFASLGSRLGTYLHTGQITPDFRRSRILDQNISSSTVLTLITSIYLGILASMTAKILGMDVDVVDMILISTIAGFLSAIVILIFTIIIAFLSYRHGWDPDNVTAPLITLIGDMLTLPLLFLSLLFILEIDYGSKLVILSIISLSLLLSFSVTKITKIIKESLIVLLICGALGILSGAILGGRIEGLVGLPSVLIMLPAFLADGGAIGGIVASRLSSALHLGSIDVEGRIPREVVRMFVTVHLLGFIIFTMIGSIAFLIAKTLGISTLSLSMTVMVSVLAGEMLLVAVNLIAYYVSIISFKRGIDPDNVSIPTITSVVDLVGVASLIVVLIIVGNSTCI